MPVRYLRLLLSLVVVAILVSCATPASRFTVAKHGVVVGSLLVTAPEDISLYEIQLVARKKKASLVDAINVYLKPGKKQSYQYILTEGEYYFTALQVHTGGARYLQEGQRLPLFFKVRKGEVARLGNINVRLFSRDGLFGRTLDTTAEIIVSKGDTAALDKELKDRFPELPDMPILDQSLSDVPIEIKLEREDDKLRGNSVFSF